MIRFPRVTLLVPAALLAALVVLPPSAARAQDHPPAVLGPTAFYGTIGVPFSFVVLATDPDGDAISSFTAAHAFGNPLPPGATFTTNATNTSGTFQWTADFIGQTNFLFTATNTLTTQVYVYCGFYAAGDALPVVTAPATAETDEQVLLAFTVTASDPDGQPMNNLRAGPLPLNATFTVNASMDSGTFSWLPTFTQSGLYRVTFVASDGSGLGQSGSATTFITIHDVPHAPAVGAPAAVQACTGLPLEFNVIASDADGDAITSLTAAPLPSGATFSTNAAQTSGTFAWTPTAADAGTVSVTFTASNALSGSATTAITAATCDAPPVVTAPSFVSGQEGTPISFTVTALSPDGEPIVQLAAAPLPATATFTTNATNTAGTFAWTPGFDQAGSYSVTFTATTSSSGSTLTNFSIANVDRAPVVTAPSFLTACPGRLVQFVVQATDPDGDAINSLTVTPSFPWTFTVNATNTSGTFSWTPGFGSEGSYQLTFTASNVMSGSSVTNVTIFCPDRAPVVIAPASVNAAAGSPMSFTVSAVDPDADAIVQLTASPLPVGATFTSNVAHTSGTFAWTPAGNQTGVFNVTFTASNSLSGSATTMITVSGSGTNLPPVAEARGPYSGLINSPVYFSGTDSYDPNGDLLTYSWAFGDGGTGTGPTPTHAYNAAGSFTATLTVSDGFLTGSDTAPVYITALADARVFVSKNRFRRIRLGSTQSGRTWCAQIEPIGGNFSLGDVSLGSIQLTYGGASVRALASSKGAVIGDSDGNGVADLEACFLVADLQTLGFPAGTNTVTVTVSGGLLTGGSFSGNLSIEVVNGSGALAVSLAPNPLNPEAVLSFRTSRAGPVRVRIFDLTGRLVRTVFDAETAAGPHEVRIAGRTAAGTPLASGVYFYRIEAFEGTSEGRFTILK